MAKGELNDICSASIILALTIIAMASCIKVARDEFNWMEQKYYARLKELDLKKRRMKMSECVKETKCTHCIHRAVCKHKSDFLRICEAVDKAKIHKITDNGHGEWPISNCECFGGVDVKCKYYDAELAKRKERLTHVRTIYNCTA